MGYGATNLNFDALRGANVARLPTFKNARGEPAHSQPDGSDWALSAWANAVTGELGEAANLIKKIERGDLTLDDARPALAKELADVQTYLDLLAFRAGVNLGNATIDKFNEVSLRVGSPVRLAADDWHYAAGSPTTKVRTKEEWTARCASRFKAKGGLNEQQAADAAAACWGVCLDDAGSEEGVLDGHDPADAADSEMSCWEP